MGQHRALVALVVAGWMGLAGASGASVVVGPGDARMEAFVDCQRAIEEVYRRHRDWPAGNAAPRPPLADSLDDARLRELATERLRHVAALETHWQRGLDDAELRREIERMARRSKQPGLLADLWAALDDDPRRVAECLVRPRVARRLVRAWYAEDRRFHGELAARAGREHQALVEGTGRALERVVEIEYVTAAAATAAPASEGVTRLVVSTTELAALRQELAADAALPPGVGPEVTANFGPLRSDRDAFHTVRVVEVEDDRLLVQRVAWDKTPFSTWWEATAPELAVVAPALDAPAGELGGTLPAPTGAGCEENTWSPIQYYPANVGTGSLLVATGSEVVALASRGGDVYDTATDRWQPMSLAGAPQFGTDTAAVWTGSRVLVFGGTVDQSFGGDGSMRTDEAGLYDPATDTWTPISSDGRPGARGFHSAVWTGSEMIVWGGADEGGYLADGARYRPSTDTWTPLSPAGAPTARARHEAVWTGSRMLVWGGHRGLVWLADGASYDPATDQWAPVATAGGPEPRSYPAAVWSGSELLLWGGCIDAVCAVPTTTGTGFRYDPSANAWSPMSTAGAPINRRHHTGAWTGEEMIVWGGCYDHDCSNHIRAAAAYDPDLDAWRAVSDVNAPSPRSRQLGVWTGSELMIWAGCDGGECQFSAENGGRYDPATDSWAPVVPDVGGAGAIAVWTGTEMILYGANGRRAIRYDPALDDWTMTSDPFGTLASRQNASAVWTGQEMVVWGGSQSGIGPTPGGARYDPAADTWTATSTGGAPAARELHQAFWTGSRMLVWGGCTVSGCTQMATDGGLYDPGTDTWEPVATAGAPSGRIEPAAVWTGTQMLVWGGTGLDGPFQFTPLADGGVYDLASDSWSAIASAGAPGPRESAVAAWSGTELLVWGGWEESVEVFGDGARYSPASDTWTPIGTSGAPAPRARAAAEWTGDRLFVWGGCSDPACYISDPPGTGVLDRVYGDGALYDPVADTWSPVSPIHAPRPRHGAVSVWTGSELLMDGGRHPKAGYFSVDDGGAFCPPAGWSAAVPGVSEELRMSRPGGSAVELQWAPSCGEGGTDYAVYEGTLGEWYDHAAKVCSTGGATVTSVMPDAGDRYFLIVPLMDEVEGSSGVSSAGALRPAGENACRTARNVEACP